MPTKTIHTHIDDRGIATVTMNNPDKHNAFDDAIIAELHTAFNQVNKDPNARAMVLAAKGKSFSAGADLGWMKRMANYSFDENLRDANALASMLKCLNNLSKPTIARVQGAAYGGAVGLVSCCDMAVGTNKASFSLSEVKIGLVPATISPYVIAVIGQRAARRYFLTAERFKADEAKSLGLITTVADNDEEMDASINALLSALLQNSPQAIGASKQLISDVSNQPITDALVEQTCTLIASIRVSPEGQEGLGAFLEKRPAAWLNNQ